MKASAPTPQDLFEVLLEKKRLLGTDVIDYPASMLQRRFRLGYGHTLALLNELESRGLIRRTSETSIHILLANEQGSNWETNNA